MVSIGSISAIDQHWSKGTQNTHTHTHRLFRKVGLKFLYKVLPGSRGTAKVSLLLLLLLLCVAWSASRRLSKSEKL